MTFTVIRTGRDAELTVTSSMIAPAIAWYLAAAITDVLSPSDIQTEHWPVVNVTIDGTAYGADVDTVCVLDREVDFVILRADSFAESARESDTSYFIRISRTQAGWETAPNMVVMTNDGDDGPGFTEIELHDRLAFFFAD